MKQPRPSNAIRSGMPLERASGAVVLIHGRGSSGEEIAGLAEAFDANHLAYLAPSAAGGTWYPQRFFVPIAQNEPYLSEALGALDNVVAEILAAGIALNRIGIIGFSQGGCLALEYVARKPREFGFVAGLSAALIGPIDAPRAEGNLKQLPVLLGCAAFDAHIPREYVEKSAEIFEQLGGLVTKMIFPGSAHTVFPEEIAWLKTQLAKLA